MATEELGELKVKLSADIQAAMDSLRQIQSSLQQTSEHAEKSESVMKQLGEALKFEGLKEVFEGLKEKFSEFIGEFDEAKAAQMRLRAVISNSSDMEGFERMGEELQKVTNYSKDATLGAAAMLANFNLSDKEIAGFLPTLQDYAAFMGKDLVSSAEQLGRSLADGTIDTRRLGIALSDTQKQMFAHSDEAQRLAMMTDLLSGKFGGLAEQLSQTASGAMTRLQNQQKELAVTFGDILNKPMAEFYSGIAGQVEALNEQLKSLSPQAKESIGSITGWSGAIVGAVAGVTALRLGIEALGGMTKMFAELRASVTLLSTTLLPVAAAMASLVVLKGAMSIGSNDDLVTQDMASVSGFIKGAFNQGINDITGGFKDLFDGMFGGGEGGADGKMPLVGLDGKPVAGPMSNANNRPGMFGSMDMNAMQAAAAQAALAMDNEKMVEGFADFAQAADKFQMGVGAFVSVSPEMQQVVEQLRANGALDKVTNAPRMSAADIEAVRHDNATSGTALGKMGAVAGSFGSTLGADLTGKAGMAGNIIQGFVQGGPIAGVANILAQAMSQTKGFQDAMVIVSDMMGKLATALQPLMKALVPLLESIQPLTNLLDMIIYDISSILGPVLKGLSQVIGGVSYVILEIIKGIGEGWNGIINAIDDVLGWVGVDLSGLKVDTSGLDSSIDAAKNAMEGNTKSVDDNTAANHKAANQLNSLNIPQGFKVAADRYASIVRGLGDTVSAAVGNAPSMGYGGGDSPTPGLIGAMNGIGPSPSGPAKWNQGLLDGSAPLAPSNGVLQTVGASIGNSLAKMAKGVATTTPTVMGAMGPMAGGGIGAITGGGAAPGITVNGGINVNTQASPDAVQAAIKAVQAKQSFLMTGLVGVHTRQLTGAM